MNRRKWHRCSSNHDLPHPRGENERTNLSENLYCKHFCLSSYTRRLQLEKSGTFLCLHVLQNLLLVTMRAQCLCCGLFSGIYILKVCSWFCADWLSPLRGRAQRESLRTQLLKLIWWFLHSEFPQLNCKKKEQITPTIFDILHHPEILSFYLCCQSTDVIMSYREDMVMTLF